MKNNEIIYLIFLFVEQMSSAFVELKMFAGKRLTKLSPIVLHGGDMTDLFQTSRANYPSHQP